MSFHSYLVDDVPFYDGDPFVSIIGQTTFNPEGFDEFIDAFGFAVSEGQMAGSDGEKVIEAAARSCYRSYGKGRPTPEHLENIRSSNHGSVTRHASVTLAIGGVSRGLTHELCRHAVGNAISQSSSRYCNPRPMGFVVPHAYRYDPPLREQFEVACIDSLLRVEDNTQLLRDSGFSLKEARGATREELPIALAQLIYFTFNVQSFRHMLRMRGNQYAEAQIRDLARCMAPIAIDLWPHLCDDIEVSDGLLALGVEI